VTKTQPALAVVTPTSHAVPLITSSPTRKNILNMSQHSDAKLLSGGFVFVSVRQ
jgi:hypothetical protein